MSGMTTRMIIHILHVFIIGGIFLYVGLKRDAIPQWLFTVLVALGVIIMIYHLYKAYDRITNKTNPRIN